MSWHVRTFRIANVPFVYTPKRPCCDVMSAQKQTSALEIRKTVPVSYLKIQIYAERNADNMKAIGKFGKKRGLNAHTLQ